MALELEEPPALLVEDTWSAGRDSGTGCNVGVLIVLEAVVVVKTGPSDPRWPGYLRDALRPGIFRPRMAIAMPHHVLTLTDSVRLHACFQERR